MKQVKKLLEKSTGFSLDNNLKDEALIALDCYGKLFQNPENSLVKISSFDFYKLMLLLEVPEATEFEQASQEIKINWEKIVKDDQEED